MSPLMNLVQFEAFALPAPQNQRLAAVPRMRSSPNVLSVALASS